MSHLGTAGARGAEPGSRSDTSAMHLLTGPIDGRFEPARDIPLGCYCFCDRDAEFLEWAAGDDSRRLPAPERMKPLDDAVDVFCQGFLAEMAAELNERLGVGYGYAYWHIQIMRYLLETAAACVRRSLEIDAALALADGRDCDAEVSTVATPWPFDSMQGYISNGMRNPWYGAWIAGLILRQKAPAGLRLIERDRTAEALARIQPTPRPQAPGGWHGVLRRLRAALLSKRFHVLQSFDSTRLVDRLADAATSAAMGAWLDHGPTVGDVRRPEPPAADAYDAARRTLGPAVVAAVETAARAGLPACYRDGFEALDAEARSKKVRPGAIRVYTPSYLIPEAGRFEAAHAAEAGEALVFLQHGANYGVARSYSLGSGTEYRFHAMLTWGWTRHDAYDGRFVPVPVPGIARLKDRHAETSSRVIYIAKSQEMVLSRTISIGDTHNDAVALDRVAFFDGLDGAVRGATVYRGHRVVPATFGDRAHMAERCPDVAHLTGELMGHLTGCRLAVIEGPGTALLLALAANVPAVAYWRDDAFALADSAKPAFDALRRAGIVHATPEAAAAAVNRVWGDVAGWWRSADVQAARAALCDSYAMTRADWRRAWIETLRDL